MGNSKSKQIRKARLEFKGQLSFFPESYAEADRLATEHNLLRSLWSKNYSSPITDRLRTGGARVLQIQCHVPTWVCDMASDFQQSNFTAVITKTCMVPNTKPFNVTLVEGDILQGLIFDNDMFDFVFLRSGVLSWSRHVYQTKVIPEALRVLKHGGYLEIEERDHRMENEGPFTQQTMNSWRAAIQEKQLDPVIGELMKPALVATGQMIPSTIKHLTQTLFIGQRFGGNLGAASAVWTADVIRGILIFLKTSSRDIERLTRSIVAEASTRGSSITVHRVLGRKR